MFWWQQFLSHHCYHPFSSVTQGKPDEAYQLNKGGMKQLHYNNASDNEKRIIIIKITCHELYYLLKSHRQMLYQCRVKGNCSTLTMKPKHLWWNHITPFFNIGLPKNHFSSVHSIILKLKQHKDDATHH